MTVLVYGDANSPLAGALAAAKLYIPVVHCVSDVMYDAARFTRGKPRSLARSCVGWSWRGGPTCWRPSTVMRTRTIRPDCRWCSTRLAHVARRIPVVLPFYPRTRKELGQRVGEAVGNFMVIDPVGCLDMGMLERNARLIVTDLGGVQKEAFIHGVPCVTLRYETE
mgnify:CR=1 FL=1